mgnify:CR=1 FL=1
MKKNKIEHYSDKEALDFHNTNKSGKIEIISSKPMTSKRDLALAYSPGVAAPVKAISKNPDLAYDYTTKGNLVAVISNGSAILGLGNLGAVASKPVMEGKAVLFKRFADIDSIDIEIDSSDTKEIINSVKSISKSFGGINLEDIKAPECFIIENELKKLLDIIWDENNYNFVSKKKMDKESFNDMKKVLQSRLNKNLKTIQKISLRIEDKISSIDQSSFSFNALPKLLKQIQSFDLKKDPFYHHKFVQIGLPVQYPQVHLA